uniref:Uncharacterized protein n=1 Tax=Biomphalaria glabrata TaxID=6526 RepID=A0A2C9LP75_BIOGL
MDSMVMPTPVNNAPSKLSEASMTHIEMNANVGSETTLSHSFTDTKTSSKNIENSSDLTYAESRNQLYQKNSLSDIKDQNFTFQKYIPSVTSAGQPSAWLNSNIPLDNTIKNSFLTQSQNPVGSQTTCVQDYTFHTEYDSLSNSVEFTCIENLKYDFLIKEAKESAECQEEALSLRHRFEEIKKILLTGSIEIWEEYKSCVESELASFIKQIETLRVHHRWSEMRILSEKKQIAERELAILRERLPELKI